MQYLKVFNPKEIFRITAALLVVVIPLFGSAQNLQSRWQLDAGISYYDVYADGAFQNPGTNRLFDGSTLNPLLNISYSLNNGSQINFQYEYGALFTGSVITSGSFLQNIKHNYQLSYNLSLRKERYLIFGLTAIDQKLLNYFPSPTGGNQRIFDDIGPAIGIGFNLPNQYRVEVTNDVLWDFVEGEFSFLIEHTRIRLKKELFKTKQLQGQASDWYFNWAAGFNISYNHYRNYYETLPYLQKQIFADVNLDYVPWKISWFWRRGVWLDIEPLSTTAQSEYIISNNIGLMSFTENRNWKYGLSYFSVKESLYEELEYAQDSIVSNSRYPYKGASGHLERRVRENLYAILKLDVVMNLPLTPQFEEFIRFNLGLRYEL